MALYLFRNTLALVSTLLISLGGSSIAGTLPGPGDLEETNLGPAIESVTIPGSAQGEGPDGEDLIYVVANGNPAIFSAVEAPSGRLFFSAPLPGVHGSWGLTVSPDRTVYIATNKNGHLYRWRPGDEKPESIAGSEFLGETHLWRVSADEQGRIYGGTYPNGKVFRYDPATGDVRDYGTVLEGVNYVRSTAVAKGSIYAGLSPQAHLFEIDAESGEKREIKLPAAYGAADAIYDLTAHGDYVFARLTPYNDLLVYDRGKREWIKTIPDTAGYIVSPPGPDGRFYFSSGSHLTTYDPVQNRVERLEAAMPFAPRSFRWSEVQEDGFEGPSLISAGMRGEIFLYNPASEKTVVRQSEAVGAAITIRSLETGPDGLVYVGGYLAPQEMARFDPDTGKFEKLPFGAQIEAMHVHDKKLVLGRYPGASVWELDPARQVGKENPRQIMHLADQRQDRPFAFASVGDWLAIGTVAKSGHLTGALALVRPDTGETKIHENVVPNQSIVSLAPRDGLLYGGTTVWGGLGIDPVEPEACLFIWDTNAGKKTWQGVPLKGEKAISDLTFTPDGKLWGITGSKLFCFDPKTREVTDEHELYSYDWPRTYWQSSFLAYDAEDGNFYGTATGRFFVFNPPSGKSTILSGGASYFARDREGNFYYSRGTDLIQARLPK